jgi:hypothetical protein
MERRSKPWFVTLLFLGFLVIVGLMLVLSVMVNLDGKEGLEAFEDSLRSFAGHARAYVH